MPSLSILLQPGSVLEIYFPNYLLERKPGHWQNRIIDIAPGSKYSYLKVVSIPITNISHDVAPRTQFELTFNRVYSLAERNVTASRVDPQEIALVFIIMAQGTIFNIEMPYYDSSAEEWLHLSERALVKGEFLSNNTVAGVQTLVSPLSCNIKQVL